MYLMSLKKSPNGDNNISIMIDDIIIVEKAMPLDLEFQYSK